MPPIATIPTREGGFGLGWLAWLACLTRGRRGKLIGGIHSPANDAVSRRSSIEIATAKNPSTVRPQLEPQPAGIQFPHHAFDGIPKPGVPRLTLILFVPQLLDNFRGRESLSVVVKLFPAQK